MALADFFDKAALGAAQLLRGFDRDSFAAALEARVVGIAFDEAAARSQEGRVTLTFATNLLARLYPRLAIVGDGTEARGLAAQLADEARAVNPRIELSDGLGNSDACVAVGASPVAADGRTLYLGSDGWITKVSPIGPTNSGQTANPFGAAAAACFGAANVFRVLFAEQLPHGCLDEPFALSLLDLDPRSKAPANPALGRVDLGETHLVGLGAIGNAATWVLARMADLRGTLQLIDQETVDPTNLQRYVLTTAADVGVAKVDLAARALRHMELVAVPHGCRWGEYLGERQNWHLERVAVALDSAADRCAVQAALPRWITNAWTQPGDLGVSRHAFLGADACLMCLYLPSDERPHDDTIIAASLGLPDALMEVRTLLATGAPVERAFIERIAGALNVPAAPLVPFEGRPLRAFYSEAVCGGIVLRLSGGAGAGAEVPMAFQSALAGILLAVELVAHASGLPTGAPRVATRINLLAPLGQYLTQADKKHPSGRCICQDQDYIVTYRAKYQITD